MVTEGAKNLMSFQKPFLASLLCTRDGVVDTRLEAKAKDTKKFRGQGHRRKYSNKKVFKNVFQVISKKGLLRKTKKGLRKFSARFLGFSDLISTVQIIVLSSSLGQGNFRGLEASRPRTSKCVLEAKDVLEDSSSLLHTIVSFPI